MYNSTKGPTNLLFTKRTALGKSWMGVEEAPASKSCNSTKREREQERTHRERERERERENLSLSIEMKKLLWNICLKQANWDSLIT